MGQNQTSMGGAVQLALFLTAVTASSSAVLTNSSRYCRIDDSAAVTWVRCPSQNKGAPILTIGANHVTNNCAGPGVSPPGGDPGGFALCATQQCTCNTWDRSLNKSAYRESTLALYGDDEGWAKHTAGQLRSWGFNTAGAWSSTMMETTGVLFTVVLDMGVTWIQDIKFLLPDVFDPV